MEKRDLSAAAALMFAAVILVGVFISYAGGDNGGDGGAELGDERISVTVNGTEFTATLYDNEAAESLLSMLREQPMELNMAELNSSGKYCCLETDLPASDIRPGTIHAGDISLYRGNCLMIFYADHANTGMHSYTQIGRIDDLSGLAEALGDGTASVVLAPIAV